MTLKALHERIGRLLGEHDTMNVRVIVGLNSGNYDDIEVTPGTGPDGTPEIHFKKAPDNELVVQNKPPVIN